MATYDLSSVTTILDLAKMHNAKELLPVAEVLHKINGLFRTAHMEEANQVASHVFAKEVGLPTGTWRGVNEGTAPANYQTEQVVESLARLEGRSEMDEYLLDLEPNPVEFRRKHDMGHMEGYTQSVVDAFLYGNPGVDPNKPQGLQVRYNTLAPTPDNVITAGDATANSVTSVYVCQWGPKRLGLLYPRGGAGSMVKMEDMGRHFVVTNTTTGAGLFKYLTRFYSLFGIMVNDDRAVQRICNIGVSGSNEVEAEHIFEAISKLPDPDNLAGTVIYCNRTTKLQIDKAMRNRPGIVNWSKNEYGVPMQTIAGIPLVMLEGIKNTESVVA